MRVLPLGLLERRGDLRRLLLGLDDATGGGPDEQDVVGDAGAIVLGPGGHLGDRAVLALLGAGAGGPAQRERVDLPAGVAQLGVDEHPGLVLVEVGRLRGGGGSGDDLLRLLGGRLGRVDGDDLQHLGLFGGRLLEVVLEGMRQLFPLTALGLGGLAQRGLLGATGGLGFEQCLGLGGVGLVGIGLGAGAGGFFLQRAQRGGWIRGRDVGRGLPCAAGVRVAESAVEPAGELEAELQPVERVVVGAGEVVGGAVAHPAQHVEDLGDLVPHDPALLERAQQVELVRGAVAVVG